MYYISILFAFLLLFILGQCSNQKYKSLPLIYKKDHYEVVLPAEVQLSSSSWMKRSVPINHFCRLKSRAENVTVEFESKNENNLYFMQSSKEVEPSICNEETVTVVEKVSNADQLNSNFNNNVMDWFVVGFKIYKENLKEPTSCTKGDCLESKLQYENLEEEFHIVELLSIFFNKKLNQPMAAKYTLYPAKEYFEYQDYKTNKMKGLKLEAMEKCYDKGCPDPKYPESEDHYLKVVPLARLRHFTIPSRQQWVNYNTNATYLRQSYVPYLDAMDRFLETVAQTVGKLKITVGTTIITENAENEISVPDILWKVVEFEDKKNKKTYSIILILHNAEFLSGFCTKVCALNKWLIKYDSKIIDKIDCCDMNQGILVQLKANFLNLKENRNSFDLNLWKMPKT